MMNFLQFHPNKATITVAIPSGEDVALGSKYVKDLQENIVISGDNVTGTLKYVTEFTEFSESEQEKQEGNYLVIKVEEATKGQKITGSINGTGASGKVVTLTNDGILITRVSNNNNTIKLTNGNTTKTLVLTQLKLSTKTISSLSKKEIIKRLDTYGVEYDKNASKSDLLTLLPQRNGG